MKKLLFLLTFVLGTFLYAGAQTPGTQVPPGPNQPVTYYSAPPALTQEIVKETAILFYRDMGLSIPEILDCFKLGDLMVTDLGRGYYRVELGGCLGVILIMED